VEGHHEDLDLLLEQVAVGLGVEHGGAEGLHLARVVAAPHAEDGVAPRQDVGGGDSSASLRGCHMMLKSPEL